jgi:hypothetical protein
VKKSTFDSEHDTRSYAYHVKGLCVYESYAPRITRRLSRKPENFAYYERTFLISKLHASVNTPLQASQSFATPHRP